MVMVTDSAAELKRFLSWTTLSEFSRLMVMRLVLAFLIRRGRMSCSQGGCVIRSQPVHRSQITRFLCRPRWRRGDFNVPLRQALLALDTGRGPFLFIMDATLTSQAGKHTENTYSTGNRQRRPQRGRRYGQYKHHRKACHSFTFGLLITPSGYRVPFQLPHYTKEYCQAKRLTHRTTAENAALLIRSLPLPEEARVIVLGDAAYDAAVVRAACQARNYHWIFPANAERVYAGPRGERPKLRSRLVDWQRLPLATVRLHLSTGKYATHRRLSRWRVGPKLKPCVYYAYQEKRDVHSVGRVQVVFSTKKAHLAQATADDVKILMTSALEMSVSEVIELYSLRWQIELFFKELKSTLGFDQYRFQRFAAVEAWTNIAIAAVLYLEWQRARQLARRDLNRKAKRWWQTQRLHGLCQAFYQRVEQAELKYVSDRLQTRGGIAKLKRSLANAYSSEYRIGS